MVLNVKKRIMWNQITRLNGYVLKKIGITVLKVSIIGIKSRRYDRGWVKNTVKMINQELNTELRVITNMWIWSRGK
jgi:hypothetical protein